MAALMGKLSGLPVPAVLGDRPKPETTAVP